MDHTEGLLGVRLLSIALLLPSLAPGADSYCPAYPQPMRELHRARLGLERAASKWVSRSTRATTRAIPAPANLIDDYIFAKMASDGIEPAPLTNDAEFLRRVTLDLTGRIPSPEQAAAFLASEDGSRRTALIDSLVGSEAYVDNWTLFYANLFEVTSGYYNFISVDSRNLFHRALRDFVQNDRPLSGLVSDLISGTGDSFTSGPVNFLVRGWQNGDPIQDTWDTLTDRVTTRFLGTKTECISCHDGRRHLEQINLWLTGKRREQFWRQSAFFSRMQMTPISIDAFNQQMRFLIVERSSGGYPAAVSSFQPGPRPTRNGGPYDPAYLFTGEAPGSGSWRRELARMVTGDRQFARAAVNYLWAHFFTTGIVDPPDGWDLARIDPANPPPEPWTLQPTHPDLIERLADEFIQSNFSIRHIMRLIAGSNAYQLSSRYEGEWRPEFARYFARHQPRRLSAEEIYDAVAAATLTLRPMFVRGWEQPVYYAGQLPDMNEPGIDPGNISTILTNFGRGNWWNINRTTRPTVLQTLYLMNDNAINFRVFGRGTPEPSTRVGLLMQANLSDGDALNQIYLATLGRYPADAETATANAHPKPTREQWLSDIQWALLNKLDFIFNY
jgi:hypothetical protein